jgi:hypothetical protein
MTEKKGEMSFFVQVRYGGAKGSSIILTVPSEIAELMKLKHKDWVRVLIKKIRPEDV